MTSLTSLLSGVGPTNTYEMFMRLVLAGQMKMVAASSGVREGSGSQSLGALAIPALTGNQIAIVFLEVSIRTKNGSTTSYSGTLTASGTGFSVGVGVAVHDGVSANTALPVGNTVINSAFAMTTTGSQTITPSMSSGDSSATSALTGQATIFIYTPPF